MNTRSQTKHAHQGLDVVELEGQAAEDLLVSDFGALALVPTREAEFLAKIRKLFETRRKVFGGPSTTRRGAA